MKIKVTQRSHDFHACIDGKPEMWECGLTEEEAIGNLVKSHHKHFNIELDLPVHRNPRPFTEKPLFFKDPS